VTAFVTLTAPKGTPAAVANKINADVQKVLADPEIKARFDTFAFEIINWSPAEIRRNADIRYKNYEQLVKRKNIPLD